MSPMLQGFIDGMLFQKPNRFRAVDYNGRVYRRQYLTGYNLAVAFRLPIYGYLLYLLLTHSADEQSTLAAGHKPAPECTPTSCD